MFYTKEQIEQKGYTVYVDGVRQEPASVIEADTLAGWALVEETSYSAWGGVKKTTVVRKYGRVHMVIEEVIEMEESCPGAVNCNDSDCDNCDDPDIMFGNGSYI